MKDFKDAPNITFTKGEAAEKKPGLLFLSRISDERLMRAMSSCAEEELYETAIIYRDELIKRGKLPSDIFC
jgi:hypothetical protein